MANAQDPYERFKDASTTPVLDLLIGIVLMASVAGGSLALLLALGYATASQGQSRAWAFLALVGALIIANLLRRFIRARCR